MISPIKDFSGHDTLTADVCVIGSGPSGGIAAVELARGGFDVLLLEAGGHDPQADEWHGLDALDLSGAADLQFGRAIQLGGSSNLWAGRVAPLEEIDFIEREWVQGSGWPIGSEELQPYYSRAFELVGAADTRTLDFQPPPKPADFKPLFSGGMLEPKIFSWAREPFKVAPWLAAVGEGLSLRVLTDAPVTELCEAENGVVTAAHVARPDGGVLKIAARCFVLAAGGIETPRIMLNSRGRSATGIGNAHDMVGRYFSTHPKADMAALVLDRTVPVNHPLFTDHKIAGGRTRAGLGLTASAQRRHELPNHYVQLSPLMEYRASRAFEAVRGSGFINSPLIDRSAILRGVLPGLGLLAFEGISRLAGLQSRARTFVLRGFLDQYPEAGNRITLSTERDKSGMPKAKVFWRFSERDRQSVLRFFDVLDGELRRCKLGRIERSKLAELDDWPLTAIHSHFMGGTRMGADPRTSVVDADCRVHGSPNLYVAGPSVFTTYGYANPFLTLAALSFRLAQRIRQEFAVAAT